eukprot:850818_1
MLELIAVDYRKKSKVDLFVHHICSYSQQDNIIAVNHAPSLHTHHMRTTSFGKVSIMEGDGELPSHVLILQDNKQKQKSKELLLRQQEQTMDSVCICAAYKH